MRMKKGENCGLCGRSTIDSSSIASADAEAETDVVVAGCSTS